MSNYKYPYKPLSELPEEVERLDEGRFTIAFWLEDFDDDNPSAEWGLNHIYDDDDIKILAEHGITDDLLAWIYYDNGGVYEIESTPTPDNTIEEQVVFYVSQTTINKYFIHLDLLKKRIYKGNPEWSIDLHLRGEEWAIQIRMNKWKRSTIVRTETNYIRAQGVFWFLYDNPSFALNLAETLIKQNLHDRGLFEELEKIQIGEQDD